MSAVLFIFSALAFFAGATIFAAAKSAIHEIEAFQLFIISAVLFAGALVVEAINKLRDQQKHTNELLNYLATREQEKADAVNAATAQAPIDAKPPALTPKLPSKSDDVYRL